MDDTQQQYRRLVFDIEHKRAHRQYDLETIIAQHALVAVDAVREPTVPFSDRLADIHKRWRFVVLVKAGASGDTQWAAPSDAPEYRFQALVSRMISDFIVDPNTEVAPDFFCRLYLANNRGQAQTLLRKFNNYTYYLRRLRATSGGGHAFYSDATACIVSAMELGAWMDATL